MADVRCPMCGKPNPPELEECQFCGARIKPVLASRPVDPKPIKAGEKPIKRDTSEFEKVKPAEEGPIRPGEAPTKKNTAELEKALPSWLRSLRDGKSPPESGSLVEPSSDENLPAASATTPSSDSSGGLPDWLSGLDKAASEDEEIPDWLAGLRGDKSVESGPTPGTEGEPTIVQGSADWMTRLGGESQVVTPEPSAAEKPPAREQSAFEAPPESVSKGGLPDWLESLQSSESGAQELPPTARGGENLPEWLSDLPAISAESGAGEPVPAEGVPDWLNQLKEKAAGPAPAMPADGSGSAPDWLSSFGPEAGTPASAPGESVPEWLSNLEAKSGPGSGMPAVFSSEPQAGSSLPSETPDWLSQLQADVNAAEEVEKHKDDFEVVSESPTQAEGTGPLPEWLAGLGRGAPPSSGMPSLIVEDKDNPPGGEGETAFSMEAPDWLSKLKPERGAEKGVENEEEQAVSGGLETAELPSWVQAMRPVESVVAEAKTTPLGEDQVTEQSGPLAGLRGVLPSGPGLGPLRRPPAYSAKLQVSDGQQRYAAYLDRLVAGETSPRAFGTTRLTSNQLWRWLIALLLILAVGIPLFKGVQVAPGTSLLSSDKGAAFTLIGGLPANVPVLIVFDYDPALSGELEATAAPLVDELLRRGTPLALISTYPTGSALAERFMQTTPLVNSHQYRSGEQYVNLGYLAGGPVGMSYFADDPTDAMPFTVDGKPAWETNPLQGVQGLSNFAAFVILTDNADTGRNWIEQVGPRLGNTPMMMIISAQAEPIIRPYFDSGQLKGLVSGLLDAKIYEQSYNRPGLAHLYWSSFSVGMLVAILLIVIGAIWSAVIGWRARRSDSREEA